MSRNETNDMNPKRVTHSSGLRRTPDPIDSQLKHPANRVGSPAMLTLLSIEDHGRLPKAHPSNLSTKKLIPLWHTFEAIHNLAINQPEIARIQRQVDGCRSTQKAVKQFGRSSLKEGLALTSIALGIDNLKASTDTRHTAPDQLRRVCKSLSIMTTACPRE